MVERPRVLHSVDGTTDAARRETEGRTVHLPGRGKFFVHANDGANHAPALVLLHGLAACADHTWSPTIRALGDGYRIVAPDIRGHGRTHALQARFTLEDAADDIAALADALSLESVVVVGYSMGGAIAQLVCRRHRDLVSGLVLCATSRAFR